VVEKLYSGRSVQQKAKLAEEVTKAVMAALEYGEDSISVGIEVLNRWAGQRRYISWTF
jgi:4-oxalocrotonate tautomerase